MPHRPTLPPTVYLLSLTIFSLVTAEFMVAGMMPALAEAFSVSLAQVGNLIAYYALGMCLGGPPMTIALLALRVGNKTALVGLLALYVAAGVLAAVAQSYEVLALARIVMGIASAACIGLCMTICAGLVASQVRGQAVAVVLAGLMLSPVAGVPLTTWVEQHHGWRASAWLVVGLALLCTVLAAWRLPAEHNDATPDLRREWASLRNRPLWGAYVTSGLIIGATFAAFSYCTPILVQLLHVAPAHVAPLLALYGVANVIGNTLVGRIADRHTRAAQAGGLVMMVVLLAGIALSSGVPVLGLACFIGLGLTGVALNPAMVARVMRAAEPGALVNTLHSSVITAGLAFGSWAGGEAINAGLGLQGPLWVGAAMAALGLASLLPRSAWQPANACATT
ncbi:MULTISPECIES: MFS transporter [unclassified Pseudomonas]|uniref:MFS transporter n=1 Tax=unclassified Pseudomonas TaxID=196821 RepID=UPI000BD3DC0B|nr:MULTISPECIES: MFS transporter [unclassified Pseudomonas]PVZ20202.1 putative MFS family arabinose efflux permease [Pseudomonas sp. URIL14HWK12:I12]PVZ27268.1 putative MFS family arabinose efflux permease [Pseudomonas sp. URIL14HWK12:I10]PVZ38157.1 putative MFS family arabinose efflux permease [Pseudomonas sp. URIL14HWK12:I11]SNZ04389.1 Predicted arabinose efflux permease, MFS family [Pseudomonas sp. URIL14HWK12:I9]